MTQIRPWPKTAQSVPCWSQSPLGRLPPRRARAEVVRKQRRCDPQTPQLVTKSSLCWPTPQRGEPGRAVLKCQMYLQADVTL